MSKFQDLKRDDSDDSTLSMTYSYKSHIAPRATTIIRRTGGPAVRTFMQTQYSSGSATGGFGFGIGGVPLKPKSATVVALTENREKEKRDLVILNDKFASYVERVRFLEVYNKKIQIELDALKTRVGSESGKIREMFEVEIKEAKSLIDETTKEKIIASNKAKQCKEDADKFSHRYDEIMMTHEDEKEKIDSLNRELAENEAEIGLLKRQLAELDEESKRYKFETQGLLGEIQRVTAELDSEVLFRVQLENEKAGLEEELSFIKQKNGQEIEELRQNCFIDVGLDSTQFFKSELANAIREIRGEYEQINNSQHSEMEQWFRLKIQEIQTRNRPDASESIMAREEARKVRAALSDQRREIANMKARNAELDARIKEVEELLRNESRESEQMVMERDEEIGQLRRKQESILTDHEELTRMKTTLETEIQTYRSLLEGDANRDGLKQVVEGIEERARQQLYSSMSGSNMSTSYSFTVHSTSGGGSRFVSNNAVNVLTEGMRYGSISSSNGKATRHIF